MVSVKSAMRRVMKVLVAVFLLWVVLIFTLYTLGLVIWVSSLVGEREREQLTRRHLGIPSSQQVDTNTIRSTILSSLPLGSSATQVYSFLEQHVFYRVHGLIKDKSRPYYFMDKDGDIDGWIAPNPAYCISFEMGADGQLHDVKVFEYGYTSL